MRAKGCDIPGPTPVHVATAGAEASTVLRSPTSTVFEAPPVRLARFVLLLWKKGPRYFPP